MNRHFTPDEMLRADGVTFHGAADLGRFRAKALADCRVDHAADYIIKGVVARGDLALIYGQPGSGKTLLGPLLAHAAATAYTAARGKPELLPEPEEAAEPEQPDQEE